MKKLIYSLLACAVLVSCSDFQKALKSEDTAMKFKLGTEYYDAGKWNKAHRLFAQIVPNYAGKPQAEKLMYMYAMTSYNMEDYFTSGYRLERFVSSYPSSEKREEALFLSAKSYYELSPIFSKEQKETIEAQEKLQLFINAYPTSQYLPEANKMIKELDFKLEKKAFEIAKQYNTIRDYKASVKSFNNFLLDFPGATLREDALFYRLKAETNLATASIEALKEDRKEIGISYYNALVKSFPNTKYLDEANEMKAQLENLQIKEDSKK
ncbi:outer membrane protein assembly factor BamD [Winogradskyella maritima]|uniref:Outer membrane protein assembly factor BamD n=1 Tax=Winogradskyella maritima TaxID=1517766 RepID=A0ABV8AGH6_9FLAO|nr:outer membrane protein assembly factor BamD [Winogradskyella maritima]